MSCGIYRFICILNSIKDGNKTPSTMDASPDYLHIHILNSEYLKPFDEFAKSFSWKADDNSLYQWGVISEKDAKIRSAKVSAREIKQRGQVGLGSAAIGSDESWGDFTGGGKGFLADSQNFCITRGNRVFEVDDNQTYWIFQVAVLAILINSMICINFGATTENEMPEQFERWLNQGLLPEKKAYYGQRIIDRVAKYIPAMKEARLRHVIPGIVKSKGSIDLEDRNSPFHKWNYDGVEEKQIG